MTPMIHGSIPRFSLHTSAMAFTWVAHPIPKDAKPANTAKTMPSHFMFSPRSRAYIAPPCIRPSAVFTRYLTAISDSAYFVAMPNTPVSQHQSTAPGPPRAIAVPTPMIFPVPMVDASAVVRAPNWLTSPSASSSLDTESGIPFVMDFLWINPVRTVINRCVPRSRMIIHHPHTKSSTDCTISNIFSYMALFLPDNNSGIRNAHCPQPAYRMPVKHLNTDILAYFRFNVKKHFHSCPFLLFHRRCPRPAQTRTPLHSRSSLLRISGGRTP